MIVHTDTNYWQPYAKNVKSIWKQDERADFILASIKDSTAIGASKRFGSKLISYDSDFAYCSGEVFKLDGSYSENDLANNSSLPIDFNLICIEEPNNEFASYLSYAVSNGIRACAIGPKSWGLDFYIGNISCSPIELINSCSCILTSNKDIATLAWAKGRIAIVTFEPWYNDSAIEKPEDIIEKVNMDDNKYNSIMSEIILNNNRKNRFEEMINWALELE